MIGNCTELLVRYDPSEALNIIYLNPRGFCAGVDRAIQIVKKALLKFGAPVYVNYDIVHNEEVIRELTEMGAIFLNQFSGKVDNSRPFIISAHGAPPQVVKDGKEQFLGEFIDATCPLVSKVHSEVRHFVSKGYHIVIVGKRYHPETIGTRGYAPDDQVTVYDYSQGPEGVALLNLHQHEKLAYVTQTTLAVSDAVKIIKALRAQFPHIEGPPKKDICYAVENRQSAVRGAVHLTDTMIIVGDEKSSNTEKMRVVAIETAQKLKKSYKVWKVKDGSLIDTNDDVFKSGAIIALTGGASAPEKSIDSVVEALAETHLVNTYRWDHISENEVFNLPRILRADAK